MSNLPWGRQITVNGDLALFYRDVCAEMRRVLAPGGRIALLTNAPQLVGFRDLRRDIQFEISLYGQTPTILTFTREDGAETYQKMSDKLQFVEDSGARPSRGQRQTEVCRTSHGAFSSFQGVATRHEGSSGKAIV